MRSESSENLSCYSSYYNYSQFVSRPICLSACLPSPPGGPSLSIQQAQPLSLTYCRGEIPMRQSHNQLARKNSAGIAGACRTAPLSASTITSVPSVPGCQKASPSFWGCCPGLHKWPLYQPLHSHPLNRPSPSHQGLMPRPSVGWQMQQKQEQWGAPGLLVTEKSEQPQARCPPHKDTRNAGGSSAPPGEVPWAHCHPPQDGRSVARTSPAPGPGLGGAATGNKWAGPLPRNRPLQGPAVWAGPTGDIQ